MEHLPLRVAALVVIVDLLAPAVLLVACSNEDAATTPPLEIRAPERTPKNDDASKTDAASPSANGSGASSASPSTRPPAPPAPAPAPPPPPTDKRVFVTSNRYSGDLLGSARARGADVPAIDQNTPLDKAVIAQDQAGAFLCNLHAAAADLGGKWQAYLSEPGTDDTPGVRAADRIKGKGPWKRLDGAVALPTRSALLVGPAIPLSINEYGAVVDRDPGVWTGMAADGGAAKAQRACVAHQIGQDFPFGLITGSIGSATTAGPGYAFVQEVGCGAQNRLYCFEE